MARPESEGRHHCVVLVSGSGANDQDSCTPLGAGLFTAPLLDLASTLVAKGLAVLRYII